MKRSKRKLELVRKTVVELSTEQLENVAGAGKPLPPGGTQGVNGTKCCLAP